jgi:hypothetical protein
VLVIGARLSALSYDGRQVERLTDLVPVSLTPFNQPDRSRPCPSSHIAA